MLLIDETISLRASEASVASYLLEALVPVTLGMAEDANRYMGRCHISLSEQLTNPSLALSATTPVFICRTIQLSCLGPHMCFTINVGIGRSVGLKSCLREVLLSPAPNTQNDPTQAAPTQLI